MHIICRVFNTDNLKASKTTQIPDYCTEIYYYTWGTPATFENLGVF